MIQLEGILVPSAWDDNGNVVGMAIATRDEREYRIADDGRIQGLVDLLRQEVSVQGRLLTVQGRTVLAVDRINRRTKSP